ncbi:MAG: TonB-dependent receptor plug domain-containing protein [Deltaproteobacteria bacterium]|nr:TonB-dependent receptor plug domain-containing protein [Deltaproteobacteria bacterium]
MQSKKWFKNSVALAWVGVLLVWALSIPAVLHADDGAGTENDNDLNQMTLEELLMLDVSGVIVPTQPKLSPVTITVITQQEIEITPARNLTDLLEIYVPGALFMNHSDGLEYGIRGIISDRKNKMLVLVNGKDMGIKGHGGNTADTEAWDLNDIEKIEIIRGTGSVTYGPGAIMGVINITTKKAGDKNGAGTGGEFLSRYNRVGTWFDWGGKRGSLDYYFYGSVNYASGLRDPRSYRIRGANKYGYWNDGNTSLLPTSDYYQTAMGEPHFKFFADFSRKEWRLWLRYLDSGMPTSGWGEKDQMGQQTIPCQSDDGTCVAVTGIGEFQNLNVRRNRQAVVSLENDHRYTRRLVQKSSLSLMSSDTESFRPDIYSTDIKDASNYNWNFSEHQLFASTLLSGSLFEKLSLAAGMEYRYTHWTTGWGDYRKDFLMGDRKNIVNGPDSHAIKALGSTEALYAGDNGFGMHTVSAIGEASANIHHLANVYYSFRYDRNSNSRNLISPRLAWVSDFHKGGIAKLLLHQSVRMNNAEQLWQQHRVNRETTPERIQGIELSYTLDSLRPMELFVSGFANRMQVLGWNKTLETTAMLGEGALWGIETELKFQFENAVFGANHSCVDLIYWRLSDESDAGGFSYSDYRRPAQDGDGPEIIMSGVGDSVNNWSKNTTKLFGNVYLAQRKLALHNDVQIFWKYEGIHDQLRVVENAVSGTVYQADAMTLVNDARRRHAGDFNLRWNASVGYSLSQQATLYFYVMNIVPIHGNHRYYYDSGSLSGPYPTRIGWVEEPRVLGVRYVINFL